MKLRIIILSVFFIFAIYKAFKIQIKFPNDDTKFYIGYYNILDFHSYGYGWNVNFQLVRKIKVKDKQMDGEQYWRYQDGSSVKAEYKDNKENGEYIEYYPSGEVYYRSNYTTGIIDGIKLYYWPDGILKAVNIFDRSSLVYKKIYTKNAEGIVVDSVESVFPKIELSGSNILGDTISVKFIISDYLTHYQIDKFRIRYDVEGFHDSILNFPYPMLYDTFTSHVVKSSFKLKDVKNYLYLYGWLEYMYSNDSIVEYEGFNQVVK